MRAPVLRGVKALRLNASSGLNTVPSEQALGLPFVTTCTGLGSAPGNTQRVYSQKVDEKDGKKAEEEGDKASTSGRTDSEQSNAAADARERAAKVAADVAAKAQENLKAAASFTSGVAQELFGRATVGGKAQETTGTAQGEGASSTAGPGGSNTNSTYGSFASSAYTKAQEAFKSASSKKPGDSSSFINQLQNDVREAVMPASNLLSVMRKRKDVGVEVVRGEGPSDLMEIEQEVTFRQKIMARFGMNPVMKRVQGFQKTVGESSAAKRAQQLKDDVQERLETTDSEVVNRMQDMREKMLTESETARTYSEIRSRHPTFDMPTFLRSIKNDVPVVIKAYLEGNESELADFCSKTMLERLMGIYNVTKAQGQISDSTILEYSDVDMVDMKMLDEDPVVILHFSCQQINCIRDQYGNVVSGSPEEVNRVYYYWAVQQDGYGVVTSDGKYIPPRWMLSEMLLRGMHQLL